MGDVMFHCPLCCKETFDSKYELVKHLTSVLSNLMCPLCNDKWSTVVHLIEHLSLDNCQQINSVYNSKDRTVTVDHGKVRDTINVGNEQSNGLDVHEVLEGSLTNNIDKLHEDSTKATKTYVDLLSDNLLKPCLETQELEKESDGRYVILTDNDTLLNTGSTVVTKQNNDGTVSLTVEERKLESDDQTDSTVSVLQDNKDELYTCNTCGVSFSSVLEHIQTYHSDQDVVLEEPLDDSPGEATLEYETLDEKEAVVSDKQALRRMITDTGDIVEAPIIIESSSEALDQQSLEKSETVKKIIMPRQENVGKRYKKEPSKRYIQIIKSCNSLSNDNDELKNGPFHKVVVKEMQTTLGNKIKVYNCTACNIFVLSLLEFESHPCIKLKYACPHCPVSYENSKSLCAHMKVHKTKSEAGNVDSVVSFDCGICGTVFATGKSLKLHKRMHDPVKSRPIDPPVETLEGNTASEDKFTCQICFKEIPEDYRAIHLNFHTNSNTLNCDICNKKFHSEEYLNMHMGVHNMEKIVVGKQDKSLPYTCSFCSRKFSRPHEKVKHERIHTGEKPHECEICGKAFRVSYCLTLHMRTHTGARPYACPHCGKRFKAHSVFNHHLLTHSEVRAYKCPYCPKAFKTSVQLAGHKNSHTKPFSCKQCNRPFASLYAVRVHTEVHSRQNNLKFACALCGASYARAFALKDHVRQAHGDGATDGAADGANEIKDEDWAKGDCDVEEIQNLNKDLSHEITEMESNSDELILP